MEIRLWIVSPRKHRETWRAQAFAKEASGHSVVLDPGDHWECDNCGFGITTDVEGTEVAIPVLNDKALCPSCAQHQITKTTGWSAQREVDLADRKPSWWSHTLCPCAGCRSTVDGWRT